MNAAPELPTPVSACTAPAPASAPPTCGGTPADANAAGSSRVIDVAKTVPVIASPTVPPTCWKNVTLLLAAPIWVTGTLLWTMSGKAAKIGPTPMPFTNIHAHSSGCGVSARSCVRSARPAAVTSIEPNVSRR